MSNIKTAGGYKMKKIVSMIVAAAVLFSAACAFASETAEYMWAELPEFISFVTEPCSNIALFSADYNEDDIIRKIYEGAAEQRSEITVSDSPLVEDSALTSSEIGKKTGEILADIILKVKYTYPEMYFVENSFTIWRYTSGRVSVGLNYSEGIDNVQKRMRLYAAFKEDILSLITEDMTDFQKAVTVHDYIVMNLKYDTSYNVYDAVNMALGGSGVCQGYAQMFYDICANELGMGCGFAVGQNKTPGDAGHIWNVINIDGAWYHTDATYDDPLFRDSETKALTDAPLRVSHNYFLISDEKLKSINPNDSIDRENIDCAVECSDAYYDENRPWDDSSSAQIIVNDGAVYYISGNEIIRKSDKEEKTVYEFKYSSGGSVSAGIGIYDGVLYVSDDRKNIYRVDLSSGESSLLYGGSALIKYLRIDGGVLRFTLSEPNSVRFSVGAVPLGETDGQILGAELIDGKIVALLRSTAKKAALYAADSEGFVKRASVVPGLNRVFAEYTGDAAYSLRLLLWTDGLKPLDAR